MQYIVEQGQPLFLNWQIKSKRFTFNKYFTMQPHEEVLSWSMQHNFC